MNLEICVEKDSWEDSGINLRSVVEECVEAVFSQLKVSEEDGDLEICFLFTDDEEVRVLNKTYRGVDKPTNVLSFPADPWDNNDIDRGSSDVDDAAYAIVDGEPERILGSVAFAYETVAKEVAGAATTKSGKPLTFENHLKHLIVHSFLHLLGYDHINDDEAEEMESLETEILEKLGIEDPYA